MSTPKLTLTPAQRKTLDAGFAAAFGGTPERYFSAPGRTEIGGNHTDHQHGEILATSINLDAIAVIKKLDEPVVRVLSASSPRAIPCARWI